jgi:hypothetical protein
LVNVGHGLENCPVTELLPLVVDIKLLVALVVVQGKLLAFSWIPRLMTREC